MERLRKTLDYKLLSIENKMSEYKKRKLNKPSKKYIALEATVALSFGALFVFIILG